MKDKIDRYNKFLSDISSTNPAFFEAVTKGFNKIFTESTEDTVAALKERIPPPEPKETPTDEFIGELEKEGEIPPEPEKEISPELEPKEKLPLEPKEELPPEPTK